jgi:hypothetical protein
MSRTAAALEEASDDRADLLAHYQHPGPRVRASLGGR